MGLACVTDYVSFSKGDEHPRLLSTNAYDIVYLSLYFSCPATAIGPMCVTSLSTVTWQEGALLRLSLHAHPTRLQF